MLDTAALVLLFVLTRLAAGAAGMRFDSTGLGWFWQYLDAELLRTDLLASVRALHSQPPLFNLFLGGVLKLFPEAYDGAFASIYAVTALALVLALRSAAGHAGVSRKTAMTVCVLFLASPSLLFYEKWLFYTLFEATFLVLGCVTLARVADHPGVARLASYWTCLLVLALTRPVFHLAWVLGAGVLPFWVAGRRLPARRALAVALPFVLLITGLYVRNGVVFGSYSTSSWVGMNVARLVLFRAPDTDLRRHLEAGTVSVLSLTGPFQPLDRYPPRWRAAPPAGHPALDSPTKRNGKPNFNHLAYVAISRRLLADSLVLAASSPGAVARTWLDAWRIFFRPAQDYDLLELRERERPLAHYERWYDRLVLWSVPGRDFRISVLHMVTFAIALLLGGRAWVRALRGRVDARVQAVVLFAGLNVAYCSIIPNLIEAGENQRFKFTIEPLLWLFLGLAATRVTRGTQPSAAARTTDAGTLNHGA